ncbi:hypothetical protein Tco_0077688 [Tanacetum coccineum]
MESFPLCLNLLWLPRGGVEQEKLLVYLCSKVVADLVLPNISDRWCSSVDCFALHHSAVVVECGMDWGKKWLGFSYSMAAYGCNWAHKNVLRDSCAKEFFQNSGGDITVKRFIRVLEALANGTVESQREYIILPEDEVQLQMAYRVVPDQEMDLFAFIRHSDPTKVQIWERDLAEREVKLLKMTEGRTVSLDPPVTAASGDSGDSIDKLFHEGDDVGQEHSVERDDDVLEETISKDVSEVAVEKNKKFKRKRKTTGDASASTFPPKKLREDYHVAASITGGKSLATIRSLIPEGSSFPSGIAEPRDDGLADSVSGLDLRTCPPSKRYVISSDDSHYSNSRSEVNFFARSAVVDTLVMTIAITTIVVVDASVVQVSKDKVRSGNLETFRDSASAGGANVNAASSLKLNEPTTSSGSFYDSQDLDSKTLHNIYVPKWKVTNESVLDEPTADVSGSGSGDASGTYVGKKDCLKDKCVEQTTFLSEKDDEITHIRSLLSLKETEAVEAIRLRSQLSVVEVADAAKSTELRDLKERNFALEGEKMLCLRRSQPLSP